jgi:hypothetical protein
LTKIETLKKRFPYRKKNQMTFVMPKLEFEPTEVMLERLKNEKPENKKITKMSSFRNVCFTAFTNNITGFLNNYTPHKCIKYIIFQLERCPTTGREHIQGYAEFKDSYKLSTIQNYLGCNNQLHVEERMGSQEQAIHYCSKPVDGCECQHCVNNPERLQGPFEFGKPKKSHNGKKSISNALDMAKKLNPIKDIVDAVPKSTWNKIPQLKTYQSLYLQDRTEAPKVTILWGDSNVGKTHHAYTLYAPNEIFNLMSARNDHVWWDGYDNLTHKCILIDEFYGWLKINEFLKLCDKFPHTVECKGGTIKFLASHIIFTSNRAPETWYKKLPNRIAFVRRITECFHITGSSHEDAVWSDYKPKLDRWSREPDNTGDLFADYDPSDDGQERRNQFLLQN